MKRNVFSFSTIRMASLSAFMLLQSCVKKEIDVTKAGNNSIGPEYAGALVYSSVTLEDIMMHTNKDNFSVDNTGFVTLVYKGNLLSLKADSIVSIPAQPANNFSHPLSVTEAAALGVTPNGNTYTFKDSTLITIQTNSGTEISTLDCKTATLALNLSYGIKHSSNIKVTIPGATLGGVPFSQTIPVTVPVPYSGPVNVSQNYALDGYTIDMTNGGTAHNVIKMVYEVDITKSANSTNAGDAVDFTQTFSDIKYYSIIGYIGQQLLSPNLDTVPVTIFRNTIGGPNAVFNIVNPQIKVYMSNSYGLPIQASLNVFEGYTPSPLLNYPITGAPNPLNIPVPVTIGQAAEDSFKLDNSNSNVVSLINNFPKNIVYSVNSQSNPGGIVYTNFITDSSYFNVDMELDLPLYGTAKNFMFQDTVDYTFNTDTTYVESITVRAYFNNGFPIDVGMSITFVDSAYNSVYELINPVFSTVIPTAAINPVTGIVTIPTQATHDYTIPRSAIPQINNVKHILITAVANTTNNGSTNVKIYNYYKLDVKMGVNVKTLLKF